MPVNPEVDHVRGPANAPVTLVEYGDFECPYCGRAEPALRELLAEFGDELRFVFRNLPLADVHPRAQLAAEAAEAAGAQGKFWEMHDMLFEHQDALAPMELVRYAERARARRRRFRDELRRSVYAPRDRRGRRERRREQRGRDADLLHQRVRHHGSYDEESLAQAVRTAWARARLAT